MRKLLGDVRAGNAIALVALFVALGGTAFAAATITSRDVKNNSLTSSDIRNNTLRGGDIRNSTLTSSDVRNGSLLAADFRAGQLPAGAQGPKGDKGDKGDAGAPGGFLESLPSGKTARGTFGLGGAGGATVTLVGHIDFPFALAAAPTAHYINNGAAAPAECPGTSAQPEAAPGHFCVYESGAFNVGNRNVSNPVTNATPGATRYGAGLFAASAAAGNTEIRGTWAVTG